MSTIVGYLVGQVGEFSGLRVAIPQNGLVIGRDPKQVDVVFDEPLVSRRHAQIAPAKDGKLYLTDLQSQNGTHVNGRRITAPVALAAGDKLDFGGEGKAVFHFETAETTSVSGVLRHHNATGWDEVSLRSTVWRQTFGRQRQMSGAAMELYHQSSQHTSSG